MEITCMMIFCSFKVVFLFLILLLESNQVEVFLCFTCFYEKREFACLPEIFCNLTINKPQNRCLIPINLSILPLFQKILFLKKKSLKVFFIYLDYIFPLFESYFVVVLRVDWKKVVSIFYLKFKTMTFLEIDCGQLFLK